MRARSRIQIAVGSLIASGTIFSVALGYAMPLFAIVLDDAGFSPSVIGLNAAAPALGILAINPFVSRLYRRLGAHRSVAICCFLYAGAMLAMSATVSFWPWFALRFAIGCAVGLFSVILESWLNAMVEAKHRGRWVSIYIGTAATGFALGPQLVSLMQAGSHESYALGAFLFLAGALVLVCRVTNVPEIASNLSGTIVGAARQAPIAMFSSFVTGFISTGVVVLLPIYAAARQWDESTGLVLVTLMLIGKVAFQPAIGWWSDTWGRESLISAGLVVCVAGAAAGMATADLLLMGGVFMLGGGTAAIYGGSLALIGDRFEQDLLAVSHAALLSFYVLGNCIGPVAYGWALEMHGPDGLMLYTIAPCVLFATALVWFRSMKSTDADE